ncbi:hypothetical protein [Actinomyces sp.]|uniref:hypothetical protein n=1 Tax=Actinomyces sp. TaxID=29317 RepID=UPI0026DC8C41|nr:hypothetical protein [Actinomyces sp.]MDO4900531.1 hypothetical protein [Actinomyces sp.]
MSRNDALAHVSKPNSTTGSATTALRISSVTAIVLLIAGPGVMLVFWANYSGSNPRGYPYYLASTWGDGLFLTTAAASLVAHAVMIMERAHTPLRALIRSLCIASLGAWLGMVGGALTQFEWLMNSDIRTNWTLPSPHTFNAAGLYHAAYLMSMCGLFAGLGLLTLQRALLARGTDATSTPGARLSYQIAWFGLSGYGCLHAYDNSYLDLHTWSGVAWLCAILTAISTLFTIACRLLNLRRRSHDTTRGLPLTSDVVDAGSGVLLGIFTSICIVAIIDRQAQEFPYDAVLYALVLIGLKKYNAKGNTALIRELVTSFSFGALIGALFGFADSFISTCITAFALIGIPVALRPHIYGDKHAESRSAYGLLPTFAFHQLFGYCRQYGIDYGELLTMFDDFIAAPIIFLLTSHLTSIFRNNVISADERGTEMPPPDEMHRIKNRFWISFVAGILSVIAMLLRFQLIRVSFTIPALADLGLPYLLLFCGCLITVRAVLMHLGGKARIILGTLFIIALYCLGAMFISDLRSPLLRDWRTWLALLPVLGSGAFVANGVGSNAVLLAGGVRTRLWWVVTAVTFLGSCLLFMCTCVPTVADGVEYAPSFLSPLSGLIGGYALVLVIARISGQLLVIAYSMSPASPEEIVLRDSGRTGINQDSLLASSMVLTLALLPMHILTDIDYLPRTIVGLIVIFAIILRAFNAIDFALRNNYMHLLGDNATKELFDSAKSSSVSPNSTESANSQQRALKAHLERQAWLTWFTCFPWLAIILCLPYIKEYMESSPSDHGDNKSSQRKRTTFAQNMYNRYLLEFSVFKGEHSLSADRDLGLTSARRQHPWIVDLMLYR